MAWHSIGSTLVHYVISERAFHNAVAKYRHYQNWAVLVAGFTPLPYKAITLSAGFCRLPLLPFVICSALARGARFFLVAGAIHIWGAKMSVFIDRYFNQLVALFTFALILSVWMLQR